MTRPFALDANQTLFIEEWETHILCMCSSISTLHTFQTVDSVSYLAAKVQVLLSLDWTSRYPECLGTNQLPLFDLHHTYFEWQTFSKHCNLQYIRDSIHWNKEEDLENVEVPKDNLQ